MKWLDKIRQYMIEKASGGVDAAKSDETPSSWRRLRWFESVRALQDAGFEVKRDPQGFWRVLMPLSDRELNPDWYVPRQREGSDIRDEQGREIIRPKRTPWEQIEPWDE
jgi:hypothetical protein